MGAVDDAREVLIADRRRRVWELKIQGLNIGQIAAEVGVRPYLVRQDIARTTRMMDVTRWLETEVALDLERLNALMRVWMPLALADPPQKDAADTLRWIFERRSKLLGLDAPKRIDIRAIIADYAQREGLEYEDVVDAVRTLIPEVVTASAG